ncbi:MAG: type pilus assembly protein PilM [Chthonomonadaceae bacterium]|nr:type pilus assembly protein PilM [Chthonomonadaceae bacterium]
MKRTMKKGRSILGIEIDTSEIRVVEIEGNWPEPRILQADVIATPADAMSGGEICRPDLVGKALATLLTRMEVRTRSAVMGIPSGAVVTRVLDIPNIPEPELRAIVEGEVRHQNILPDGRGEFNYVRLDTGVPRPQARPRLLLMATEGRILDSYHQTAGIAGVQLLGLEPSLIAMYRAASPLAYSRSPCLCVMMGSAVSEVAIMDQGLIRVYRRLDLGSRQILLEAPPPLTTQPTADMSGLEPPLPRFNLDGSPSEYAIPTPVATPGHIAPDLTDNNAVNSLAVELQRSLDYYKREFPDSQPVDSIVIAGSQHEFGSLASWLSEKLQIETTLVALPASATADPALRSRLAAPSALRYIRASGLAMQALGNLPEELPLFNLLGRRKALRTPSAVSGRMTFALVFSVLVLLLGSINMFRVGQQANQLDHELDHAMETRRELSTYHGLALDEVRRQKDILNTLLPVGEPLPTVVDAMAGAVPPDASLMEISREKPGILSLSGESKTDTVLVQFLDSLRQLPSCVKVSLDSLNRNNNASSGGTAKDDTLHYQITAQIRPMP